VGAQHGVAEDGGRRGPFPETAAAEGAFTEAGVAAGLRGTGAAFVGSISPADSDPAVSAGCLLQTPVKSLGSQGAKPWVSKAAGVWPVLGGRTGADPVPAALSQAVASPPAQVIQETSGLLCEGSSEGNQYIPDSQRLSYPKVLLVSTERTST